MEVRNFHTKFFRDAYVSRLNFVERYFFTYLLINDKVNMCGIYELPDSIIGFDTGLDVEQIKSAKMKLETDKRVSFYREWVYIHNFARYNKYSGIDHILKKFAADFNNIPLEVRKYFLVDLGIPYQLPIQSDKISLDGVTVTVNVIVIDSSLGGRVQKERVSGVDKLGVPYDLDEQDNKKTNRLNGFATFLLVLLFSSIIPHTINAVKIEKRVVITSKYATQYPEELKSLTPQKQATPTRLKSGQQKSGAGTPKASTARVNKPTPPPVEAVYAPLPDFKKEVARKIKDAFPNHAREMIAIAFAESGLNCGAINQADSNGYKAVGVFQINDGRVFNDQDIANLTNCDHNIERAKQKYQASGLQPWGVYWSGAFQRYLWIYDEI